MPLMQLVLLVIPTPVLCFLIVGGSVAISVGALFMVRLFVPHHRLKQHNDVAGSVFATVGVLYAVLLAFVVIVVWEDFDKAQANVHKEANCLVDLYRDSKAFPADFRNALRLQIKEYAVVAVSDEWEAMKKGLPSIRLTDTMTNLWQVYISYIPKNDMEKAFFEESVRKLNELGESRRERIIGARTGVHPVIWSVLVLGGIVTMTFISFFGAENFKAQTTMAVLLSILVGLILFTIAVLDYPFTGSISVSPETFRMILLCPD